jgi:hypothetical protein
VELPAGSGPVREEALEELNLRRYDERCIPVLAGEAVCIRVRLGRDVAMMLDEDPFAEMRREDLAEDARRLIQDREKR